MTLVVPTVEVFFDYPAVDGEVTVGSAFILNDPVYGELDTAALGGVSTSIPGATSSVATDISSYCYRVDVNRGRSRELDEIETGSLRVGLRNYDAEFLPWVYGVSSLLDENGQPILDESGVAILDEAAIFSAEAVGPGRRVRVSVEGVVVFDGQIEDWNFGYTADEEVDAEFVAVDALGVLARKSFLDWTTTGSQSPGVRMGAVLDRSEVGFGANRDLDDGFVSLQADSVTWGSNVLNYLQLVAKTDVGRLFASRDGVLTFRDRYSLVDPVVAVEFADDGATGSIPFSGATLGYGSELLYTRVQVDRTGGTAQTVTDDAAVARYGTRTLSIGGLLADSDTHSLSMAQWLLGIYKEPRARVDGLTVILENLDSACMAAVNMLDIGDVVRVRWTPRGVSAQLNQLSVVEGLERSKMFDGQHFVRFALSPLASSSVFVLDDAQLGVLDSGVLAF